MSGITKELFVKEDGDVAYKEQEDGGEVGGQQLHGNLPLQNYRHDHQLLIFDQGQILNCEHGQVGVLRQKIREVLGHALLVHHLHLVSMKYTRREYRGINTFDVDLMYIDNQLVEYRFQISCQQKEVLTKFSPLANSVLMIFTS